jgi:hypothetical protein
MGSNYIDNVELERNIVQFQRAKRTKARCLLVVEELQSTIKRKSLRKINTHNNREVLKRFKADFATAQQEFRDAENKLAAQFFLLSENLTRYFKFHLIEPDDAIQEGVMICFEKVDLFIATKGKAFNYFTTCTANHYRQLHRTSKNYNELKKKFFTYKQASEQKIIIKNGKETIFFN